VEILKASGLIPGSTEVISSSADSVDSPSMFSWKSWFGTASTASSSSAAGTRNIIDGAGLLVPGTGIERSKFVVCASGMQTSVVVRADTDPNNEEENEMARLRKEREERLKRSSSSSSSSRSSRSTSSSSLVAVDPAEESIILGDSFQPLVGSTLVKPVAASSRPVSPTKEKSTLISESATTGTSTTTATTTTTTTTATTPMSYAAAVSQTPQSPTDHHHHDHLYEASSDTEVWRK
ncbi:hypothetical protein BGX29_007657, partial [Mortierella sp. GBA35]